MLYILICEDKPNSEALRQSVRPKHQAYLEPFDIRFAGPMLSPDNTTMIGSMIVIDATDQTAAETFAAGDPYRQSGLFEKVTIRGFKQIIPPAS